MLSYYIVRDRAFRQLNEEELNAGEQPTWIDLTEPTEAEIILMKDRYKVVISSGNVAAPIELPSCYYQKKGVVYTTLNIVVAGNKIAKLTYILSQEYLITVRTTAVLPNFAHLSYVAESDPKTMTSTNIYAYFMEERLMDIDSGLVKIDKAVDMISQAIFYSSGDNQPQNKKINFRQYINSIGQNGHILSKSNESLISISRALSFIAESTEFILLGPEKEKINDLLIESRTLGEQVSFLSDKISFLLDICFGMIGLRQSEVSKVLSISALVFLPPTFITSAYGMNFINIPLSHWEHGFAFTLVMIVLSAGIPFLLCKLKHWI